LLKTLLECFEFSESSLSIFSLSIALSHLPAFLLGLQINALKISAARYLNVDFQFRENRLEVIV
jgi:hypothetical protein